MAADQACQYIKKIEKACAQRYEALLAGDINLLQASKLQLLILDNLDAVEAITKNTEALNAYRNITGRYKQMNVCILVSALENVNIPYTANEIMKTIREQHQLLYFDDIDNLKIYDVAMAIIRQFSKRIQLGDCYYTHDNDCVKLKTALSSAEK